MARHREDVVLPRRTALGRLLRPRVARRVERRDVEARDEIADRRARVDQRELHRDRGALLEHPAAVRPESAPAGRSTPPHLDDERALARVARCVRRRARDGRLAEREQRPGRRRALHLRVRIDVVGGGHRVGDARAGLAGRDRGHDPRHLQHRRRGVADVDGERLGGRLVAVTIGGEAPDQRLAEREERPRRVIADQRHRPVDDVVGAGRIVDDRPGAGVGADHDVGQRARLGRRRVDHLHGERRARVLVRIIGHRAHDRRDLVEQEEVRDHRSALEEQVLVFDVERDDRIAGQLATRRLVRLGDDVGHEDRRWPVRDGDRELGQPDLARSPDRSRCTGRGSVRSGRSNRTRART